MFELNILVVGSGMYVCGRGTDGYGTIMPAIFEWKRKNGLGEVFVAGTSFRGIRATENKIDKLKHEMNIKFSPRYFPAENRNNSDSYRDALRKIPKPACTIVCVPDNLHAKIASDAIKEGLHTLVVKPLAPTQKEVVELIRLQKKKRVYCAVEFHKRFDRANLKLKDTLASGIIGEPLYFLVEYSQRKSIPFERFKKWVRLTNVFQYLGIHYLDIIFFATKAVPVRAMAIGQKGWLRSKGIDSYDSIEAVVEWKMPSGKRFSSHILTSWVDPEKNLAMSYQKIKVIGTEGRFESDQTNRGITIVSDKNGTEEPNPYFCTSFGQKGRVSYEGYGIESIHQFLQDVTQIIEGSLRINELEDIRPTFRQSILPTAVLEAVNKSLESKGEWVSIKVYKK